MNSDKSYKQEQTSLAISKFQNFPSTTLEKLLVFPLFPLDHPKTKDQKEVTIAYSCSQNFSMQPGIRWVMEYPTWGYKCRFILSLKNLFLYLICKLTQRWECLDAFRRRHRLFPFTSGLPRVKGKNNSQTSHESPFGFPTSHKWRSHK